MILPDTIKEAVGQAVVEPDEDGACARCGDTYALDDGKDPTPLCHPCAQEVATLLAEFLAPLVWPPHSDACMCDDCKHEHHEPGKCQGNNNNPCLAAPISCGCDIRRRAGWMGNVNGPGCDPDVGPDDPNANTPEPAVDEYRAYWRGRVDERERIAIYYAELFKRAPFSVADMLSDIRRNEHQGS